MSKIDNVYSAFLYSIGIVNSAGSWYTEIEKLGGEIMVSEKKKASNAKWDKENMTTLACRVKKEYAAKFRAACAAQGTTPNAVLKQAADDFMREHPAPEEPMIEDENAGKDADTEARRAALLAEIRGL